MSHKDLHTIANSYDSEYIDFKQFVNHYKGDKSENTIVTYMSFLGQIDFNPEKTGNLEKFDNWAREKARNKHGTANIDRAKRKRFCYFSYLALRNYLDTLEEGKELKDNLPTSDRFEQPDTVPQTLKYTEEQVGKMLEVADPQLRHVIRLMFYSGLRGIEILNITPEWLEFSEEHVEIEIPPEYAKSRKDNVKPEYCIFQKKFEDELKKYIKKQYDWEESYEKLYEKLVEEDSFEPIFDFHPDGESDKGYIDQKKEHKRMNHLLKETARKSGINRAEDITAHRLRASYMKHVHENKQLSLNKTQALARHQSAETTSKYYLDIDKQEKIEAHHEAFT